MRCVGILVLAWTSGACEDEGAKLVFTTSASYAGDLGGLAGADAKCAQSASTAGLDGTFVALLSDATTNANAPLSSQPRMRRPIGLRGFAGFTG